LATIEPLRTTVVSLGTPTLSVITIGAVGFFATTGGTVVTGGVVTTGGVVVTGVGVAVLKYQIAPPMIAMTRTNDKMPFLLIDV
jgi:hypothetical protein